VAAPPAATPEAAPAVVAASPDDPAVGDAPVSPIRRPGIDPRIRERRVAIRREEGRRRLHLLLGAAAIVVAGLLGWGITRSPLLAVHRVRVAGAAHTTTADVLRAAGLVHRRQMVDLDDASMMRAIAALPWVDTARVARRWPTTVVVTVTERHPVAIVADASGWATVDAHGRVLAVTAARPAGLLEVRLLNPAGPPPGGATGPSALAGAPSSSALAGAPGTTVDPAFGPDLTVAVQVGSALPNQVAAVGVTTDGQIQLGLAGGATALLGPPTNLADKVTALATVLAKVKVGNSTIDVRVPTAPVLTSSGHGQ
jgi:cell division protein FtsQ